MRRCAATCRDARPARCRRRRLAVPPRRNRSADGHAAARRSAGNRGGLRRDLRPRPRHVAAPVRACARRLARPRSGDDRPRRDLCEGRAHPHLHGTARLPAGRAGIRLHAAAARGARVPGRDRAHPQRALRRAVQARQRLRQRRRRADRTGRGKGAGGRAARRRAAGRKLGRARGVRRLFGQGPGPARPGATDPRGPQELQSMARNRERSHEPRHVLPQQFPLHRLPVHLPGGVLHGQPGALRPRPVHLEERLVAAAARRNAALGQQPVPRRHPVPVLRAPGRTADAALDVRALHQRAAEADAGHRLRRRRGVHLLRRPDAAAAPAHLRSAHPADQPPHRPGDSRHPVGAA